MYAHQSVAYAVNAGEKAFIDTLAARNFCAALPAAQRNAFGLQTLESALALNPYSLAVIEAAQGAATTPSQMVQFARAHATALEAFAGKPGCPPQSCLMLTEVRNSFYDRLGKLPIPTDPKEAGEVLAFLEADHCRVAKLNTNYFLAANGAGGEGALIEKLTADFKAHLAGARTPQACAAMAARIEALAASKCAVASKTTCLTDLKAQMQGHDSYSYVIRKKRGSETGAGTDGCAAILAKLVK
jgi:hypothetical protein